MYSDFRFAVNASDSRKFTVVDIKSLTFARRNGQPCYELACLTATNKKMVQEVKFISDQEFMEIKKVKLAKDNYGILEQILYSRLEKFLKNCSYPITLVTMKDFNNVLLEAQKKILVEMEVGSASEKE